MKEKERQNIALKQLKYKNAGFKHFRILKNNRKLQATKYATCKTVESNRSTDKTVSFFVKTLNL